MSTKTNRVIRNEGCPSCIAKGRDKTRNHLMVFADGGKFCSRCSHYEAPGGQSDRKAAAADVEAPVQPTVLTKGKRDDKLSVEDVAALPPPRVSVRGLSPEFMSTYGYRVECDPATGQATDSPDRLYFPRYKSGKLVGYKVRVLANKSFYSIGDAKGSDLFGSQLDGGRRLVIITEGEDDAVAAKQMLVEAGRDYRVVSVPDGAGTKFDTNITEWLEPFETIITAFDMDKPGQELTEKFTALFQHGKVKVATLPDKDARESLLNGRGQEFVSALMNARAHTPDGIVDGSEAFSRVLEYVHSGAMTGVDYPPFMPKINEMVYGQRYGELDTLTSGSGMGKTQLIREISYWNAIHHGDKLGVLSLEEPLEDHALGQMSLYMDKPLTDPAVLKGCKDEELKDAFDHTYGTGNYILLDHFGSLEGDRLTSRIRYLAAGMGCRRIILDHLSIVVSEYAGEGDERKTIDEIMTKLKRLTQELNIHILLVVHLRKSYGTPFELGGVPSLDDLRGSGSIKQLSNQVFAMSRNQQHPDPTVRNTTQLHVLKSRRSGKTGPADLLSYDPYTGRITASPMSQEEYYEAMKDNHNPLRLK